MIKRNKKNAVLLIDRKRAFLFSLQDGRVVEKKEIVDGNVPQNVKHGDDTWDAQDKIFRHIEDHFHRHLKIIAEETEQFVKDTHISEIILGGHKPLFSKIKKNFPPYLRKKIIGEFITDLKTPLPRLVKQAGNVFETIQEQKTIQKLEEALI